MCFCRNTFIFISACIIAFTIFSSCFKKNYRLLSFQEFQSKSFSTPYFFLLSAKNYHLGYYGSRHSYQTNDSQFNQLKTALLSFQPDVIFIEGGVPSLLSNEKDMIEKYGEPGFIGFFGHPRRIQIKNIEPNFSEELYHLLDIFDEEYVLVYYFVREMSLYQIKHDRLELESYISNFLEDLNYFLPLKKKEPDYIYQLYQKTFHKQFQINQITGDLWDPIQEKTIINAVSKQNEIFRNQKMVENIIEAFNDYHKVFVVAGSAHAVIQEPALRQFFHELYER